MPILLQPWFLLIGIATIPILISFYMLFKNSKKHKVSALFLWKDITSKTEAGNSHNLKLPPWLFWLELLILILLIISLTTPIFKYNSNKFPLTIILDDSYSMQAIIDKKSILDEAKSILRKEVGRTNCSEIKVIFARNTADVIELSDKNLSSIFKNWQGLYAEGNLSNAINIARQRSKLNERYLVITDHLPPENENTDSIKWISVGKPTNNIAINNCTRLTNHYNNSELLLIEVQNLSNQEVQNTIKITNSKNEVITEKNIVLPKLSSTTENISIDKHNDTLSISIDNDALNYDNTRILLPNKKVIISAFLDFESATLKYLITNVLKSIDCRLTSNIQDADLYFSDKQMQVLSNNCWQIYFPTHKNNEKITLFTKNFIARKEHPLLQGLEISDFYWGANTSISLPGDPIINYGNTTLLSSIPLAENKHIVLFNLYPASSSIIYTPTWPIIFYNLVFWRSGFMNGFNKVQQKCCSFVNYQATRSLQKITLYNPQNEETIYQTPSNSSTLVINPGIPGLYKVIENDKIHNIVATPSDINESNILKATSKSIDNWYKNHSNLGYFDITSLLLIFAILLINLQWFVINKFNIR